MARVCPSFDHDVEHNAARAHSVKWAEQDRLFPKLPARLARMVLFAINTGFAKAMFAVFNGTGKLWFQKWTGCVRPT